MEFTRLNRSLTPAQVAAFDLYARRLLEENARAGLTSAGTDRDAIYRRHFAESLALLEALENRGILSQNEGEQVIDVGSGGGFPGIPMKIARPDISVALLEPNGKKARFLASIVGELRLSEVAVIQARAEDAGRDPDHRERYGLVMSRAVAPLRVLLELTMPLLRVGGTLAAPKGSAARREIAEADEALRVLGGVINDTFRLDVLSTGPPPTVVLVCKTAPTPERYPRRAGIPAKRPL